MQGMVETISQVVGLEESVQFDRSKTGQYVLDLKSTYFLKVT
jgi:hypothetical protein